MLSNVGSIYKRCSSLRCPWGFSLRCADSQTQEKIRQDSASSLAYFATLHHLQDCETPGVEKDSVGPVWQGKVEGEASVAHPCRQHTSVHPAPAWHCIYTLSSDVYSSLRVHISCLCLRRAATVQIFIMLSRLSHEIF